LTTSDDDFDYTKTRLQERCRGYDTAKPSTLAYLIDAPSGTPLGTGFVPKKVYTMGAKNNLSVAPVTAAAVGPTATFTPRGFRIENAAMYMGTTPWYVEEVIRLHQLPPLKLGRSYTVLKEDMDKFLDTKREMLA
jgi:excisionase family DNA binding protein